MIGIGGGLIGDGVQEALEILAAAAGGFVAEVIEGAQGGHFFGGGTGEELIDGETLLGGEDLDAALECFGEVDSDLAHVLSARLEVSVINCRNKEHFLGACGAQFAFDLGHEARMIGGAHTGCGRRDDDVKPIIIKLFARDLKVEIALGGEALADFGNDGRYFE
jgi:hypothetical protein